MHSEMETATSELLRDLDIASRNAMEVPSANPSVRVALDRFSQLVKLKLVLPLTQLDAAHEDMERFLHYRLSQLHAQTELRSLLRNLTERMAAHQCRVCQIMQGEALKNIEVSQRVLVGLRADQPMESNFFPGILEGLLGSLGINAAGGKNLLQRRCCPDVGFCSPGSCAKDGKERCHPQDHLRDATGIASWL